MIKCNNKVASTTEPPTRFMLPTILAAPLGDGGGGGFSEELEPDGGGGDDEVGVVEGLPAGVLASLTSTWSFIPPEQWPGVGHMKYTVPVFDSSMVAVVPA